MSLPVCTRYPETGTVSANTGDPVPSVLNFNTGIPPVVFFDRYGLNSANINFTRTVDMAMITTVTGRLTSAPGTLQPSFTIVSDATGISGSSTDDRISVTQIGGSSSGQFIITYTDSVNQNTLNYNLTFTGNGAPDGALTSVSGFLQACIVTPEPPTCPDVLIVDPDTNTSPGISAVISLSQDCQMICQVKYDVVETFDGCCDGLVRTATTYTVYCVNLQDVMLGTGCTVRQKFDSLQEENPGLEWNTFLQYSILRLILSTLLKGFPCGYKNKECDDCCASLDVNLLRKRFAREFKHALREQIPKYYDVLFGMGSEYLGLEVYFKK